MIGVILCLLIICILTFISTFINIYAILDLTMAATGLEKNTSIGLAASISIIIPLLILYTGVLFAINPYLVAGITGVAVTTIQLKRRVKRTTKPGLQVFAEQSTSASF